MWSGYTAVMELEAALNGESYTPWLLWNALDCLGERPESSFTLVCSDGRLVLPYHKALVNSQTDVLQVSNFLLL